jgi:spore germination protein GerM
VTGRTGRLSAFGATALALALVAVVVASCGIPNMADPAPMTQPPTASRAPVTTPSNLSVVGGAAELFLVGADNMLVAVRRPPIAGDTHALVTQTLSQLTSGPDDEERARGLSSAIPPGLTVQLVRLIGTQAIVDIGGTDPGPAAEEARLATGQVVLTLTAIPQVDSVLLTRNGRPLEAVLPAGVLTELPLTRDDYMVLLAH